MSPQALEQLMAELDAEDPPWHGDPALDAQEMRQMMAQHFCELDQMLAAQGVPLTARHEIMAAIAAHTMVENMVLHMSRLQQQGHLEDGDSLTLFRHWMRRHRLG